MQQLVPMTESPVGTPPRIAQKSGSKKANNGVAAG